MSRALLPAFCLCFALAFAANAQDGPKNAVILIIRHGEKPAKGTGLSPAGKQRAKAYKHYFKKFTVDSKLLRPNAVFAAKDTSGSHRPRLTVEPFAKAEKLQVDTRFASNQTAQLAAALRATEQGKRILICWHHSDIPGLLQALGANPRTLLPSGKWPDSVYDWVILLNYNQDGRLIPGDAKRIDEHLMPDDS
jgi:hypothetical protein